MLQNLVAQMTENDDSIRIALMLQQQQQDEAKIAALEKRVDAIDHKVFAAQIGLVTIIGLGTLIGWLLNAGDKIRSWFH